MKTDHSTINGKSGARSRVEKGYASVLDMRTSDFFYYAGLAFFCVGFTLSSSELVEMEVLSVLPRVLEIVSLVLVFYSLFSSHSKYSGWEIALFIPLALCVMVSAMRAGVAHVAITTLLIFGAKGISFRSICKVVMTSIAVSTVIVALLSLAGFFKYASSEIKLNPITGTMMVRYTYGFAHSNFLGRAIACIFFTDICLRFRKLTWKSAVVWFVIALILFFHVGTYTSALIISVGAVIVLVMKRLPTDLAVKTCAATSVIFIVLSFLLPLLYSPQNELLLLFDKIASDRLYWTHYCIERYPITLFGQEIHTIGFADAALLGTEAFFLDNACYRLLLNYGVLTAFLFVVVFIVDIIRCVKACRVELLVVLALLFLSGLSTQWPLIFYSSFPLLSLTADLESDS